MLSLEVSVKLIAHQALEDHHLVSSTTNEARVMEIVSLLLVSGVVQLFSLAACAPRKNELHLNLKDIITDIEKYNDSIMNVRTYFIVCIGGGVNFMFKLFDLFKTFCNRILCGRNTLWKTFRTWLMLDAR